MLNFNFKLLDFSYNPVVNPETKEPLMAFEVLITLLIHSTTDEPDITMKIARALKADGKIEVSEEEKEFLIMLIKKSSKITDLIKEQLINADGN
jgi:hypothetical protein